MPGDRPRAMRRAAGITPEALRLLALLLAEPAADSLELLRELAAVQTWLAPAVDELDALALDRWQAEHTRLFVNGYPRTPCPPFESAYRHGRLRGSAVAELEALYARAGLQSLAAGADYLGVLLEFAAMLDEGGHDGALAPILWEEHLVRWVPRFGRDLAEHARLRLYGDLGARFQALFVPQAAASDV